MAEAVADLIRGEELAVPDFVAALADAGARGYDVARAVMASFTRCTVLTPTPTCLAVLIMPAPDANEARMAASFGSVAKTGRLV